jgi:hypothetical protein
MDYFNTPSLETGRDTKSIFVTYTSLCGIRSFEFDDSDTTNILSEHRNFIDFTYTKTKGMMLQ